MRTTLDVADDVLQASQNRARRERETTGEIICELARAALTAPSGSTGRPPRTRYGFRPFPKHRGIVTNELIDKLREEDAY